MTKSLEQQCVAALTAEPPPTLDQLLTLIAETEAGIIEAENDAEIAKAEFFDPILAPDIRVAQQRMESDSAHCRQTANVAAASSGPRPRSGS